VKWSHEMTDDEAARFTKEKIFAPYSWEINTGKNWYDQ